MGIWLYNEEGKMLKILKRINVSRSEKINTGIVRMKVRELYDDFIGKHASSGFKKNK